MAIYLGRQLLDASSSLPEGLTKRTASSHAEAWDAFCLALLQVGFA